MLLGTGSSGPRGADQHPFFRTDAALPVIKCVRNLGVASASRVMFVGLPIPCRGHRRGFPGRFGW